MDLNVENYTTEELSSLIGITELSDSAIKEAVQQQKKEHPSKKSAAFFDAIEAKLLKEIAEVPVQKTIEVDIKKGTINPDLKTTLTRLINVDSAYRSRITLTNTSDNFVFELTEPLLNVVSLALYSLELPQSWYTITFLKGTTGFLLYVLDSTSQSTIEQSKPVLVTINEGNYTTQSLCEEVIAKIQEKLPPDITLEDNFTTYFNQNKGTVYFLFTSTNSNYTIQLIWYDEKNIHLEMKHNRYNYNLGWLLGFRSPLSTCTMKTITDSLGNVTYLYSNNAESLVDVGGTKYVILSLDDYKTNRLNRSIVAVSNTPNIQLPLPKYFSKDVPLAKISPTRIQALPANPRNLTSKQIYTINAISVQTIPNNLIMGYDSSNGFAKIPIKRTDWGKTNTEGRTAILDVPNKLFVENGGPLQLQSREYFGPVDIYSLSVSLHDDKGNLLGLNGMDWSFSILAKCIYQY